MDTFQLIFLFNLINLLPNLSYKIKIYQKINLNYFHHFLVIQATMPLEFLYFILHMNLLAIYLNPNYFHYFHHFLVIQTVISLEFLNISQMDSHINPLISFPLHHIPNPYQLPLLLNLFYILLLHYNIINFFQISGLFQFPKFPNHPYILIYHCNLDLPHN